ncbi:methyl-accepting chemotaxis protein [Craterilacuibacter sp. RT1T]|uniref:methyl-accepting chemotaxis protein n=1 Tax=Craterilacuibacter sp. RT1T TaxID=2942211 RepID=UPI0020C166A4|nr:methyl-accepting chemotaxis protein [Craterilacuibacter sp. RT1T]MCL6264306.1 methyl-accepting chemotaxis protein [Craterilacuibacter sp. RT1T]
MQSLRYKLLAVSALLLVTLAATLYGVSYSQMRTAMVAAADGEITSIVDGEAELVGNWLQERQRVMTELVEVAGREEPLPGFQLLARSGDFVATYAAYGDGSTLFSDGWEAPADYQASTRDWFKAARTAGKPVVTAPYVDADSKRMMVTVAAPLSDGGAVAGDVYIDALAKQLQAREIQANGFAFLAGRDGTLIAYPQAELAGKKLETVASGLSAERLQQLASEHEPVVFKFGERSMAVGVKAVPGSDWLVGVAMDEAELNAPATRLGYTLAATSAAILAVLLIVGSLVIGRMLAGLGVLKNAMVDISQGDADLTRSLPVAGRDEIAQTAEAFNAFVLRLNALFAGLKQDASSVVAGVGDASLLVGQVADSSRSLSDVSSSNAATLEEITVSVAHIADSARQANTLVRDTGSALGNSADNITRLSDGMEGTVNAVRALEGMLSGLSSRSQEISGITDVIRDIADQTNLLALNAAIEAARAGEQGRGFAVVADEVRKLAERTAQATQQIAGMVGAIRNETSQAVGDVNKTVIAVEAGVEVTRAAAEQIGQVRHAMGEVVDKMGEITHSTTEQQEATTLIAQSTEQINSQVVENDGRLQEVSATLRALDQAAGQMDGEFAKFKL